MRTFSNMSIPDLTTIVVGLKLVKTGCEIRLQQLEKQQASNTEINDAIDKYSKASELLAVAENELLILNGF